MYVDGEVTKQWERDSIFFVMCQIRKISARMRFLCTKNAYLNGGIIFMLFLPIFFLKRDTLCLKREGGELVWWFMSVIPATWEA
jgi:hypothetical protein